MDEDLQAALMDQLEQSESEAEGDEEEDGLSASEDEEEEEAAEDDDPEVAERKQKIKQYTSEIKQLEQLIEKKRAGFTGSGNPIITKRFEETIKGLQDDINNKVSARQALQDAIDARRKEKEAADTAPASGAEAAEGEAAEESEPDDLFDDDEGDADATPIGTPITPAAPTPGPDEIPDLPSGAGDDDDDEDLFGDDELLDDPAPVSTPAPAAAGEGEFLANEMDDMDEMAELLEASLNQPDEGDAGAAAADGGAGEPMEGVEGADGEIGDQAAATAALDEFMASAEARDPGYGFVEGGVGMRRLATGVEDSSDEESEDSDDD